ncbi:MAG TPA: hypothetical protein VJN94_07875 [Candidatus Binataceae bacterium]|nr:hypothetical protein [Candidatus Binataceae bacterium]
MAQKFIRAANALNLQNYGLIGASDAAQVAIWQAIYSPECVDALVLISPPALPHEGQAGDSAAGNASELVCPLEDLKAPTLVLLGTEDRTVLPETGRTYAQRIPKCYYVLVYAAGHALAEECPEQLSGIAQDFLERRESFIVNRSSTLLTA